MLIKEINITDRPRERALAYGVNILSNSELLAILFRTGTKDMSALELGNKLLQRHSINNISKLTTNELTKIPGIGDAKALTLLAAFELYKRNEVTSKRKVVSPEDVYNYLKIELSGLKQEHFIAIYLDTKNNIISSKTIFIGGLNVSVVHPREVFKWAVKLSANSIIVAHNHPSGDPTPSPADIEATKAINEAGNTMSINLIDHIIIGQDRYLSLKELGYL